MDNDQKLSRSERIKALPRPINEKFGKNGCIGREYNRPLTVEEYQLLLEINVELEAMFD